MIHCYCDSQGGLHLSGWMDVDWLVGWLDVNIEGIVNDKKHQDVIM